MTTILICMGLFIGLAVASLLWGVDSRGLDTRKSPEPSLQTPRSMVSGTERPPSVSGQAKL